MKTVPTYSAEDTSKAKLQASPPGLGRFVRSGFGLTAHWGLYALGNSGNEWAYFNERIPFQEYKERMERFNPARFDADEWGDLLLEVGAKFFFITSKHHDGFCLFDSAHTDFSVAHTPFRRDILGELSRALHQRGIALHFYYSLVDWTHKDYRGDWGKYVEFYQAQIRELCTNYGPVGGFVFDGYWPRAVFETPDEELYFGAGGAWDLAGTYDLIHSLQPDAVIASNTHILPLRGEDYQVSELDLPGENTIGFNTAEVGDRPLASWWNLNAGWSYQPWNHRPKSALEVYDLYQKVRSRNAVFLLNVGPRPFGDIHPQEQQVLREFGWLVRGI
ncbi:MAG: alpha-L-fucosidase [Meiothermus sp.]|nr:alpha-L-fucosidase [Meiothermus sp.]